MPANAQHKGNITRPARGRVVARIADNDWSFWGLHRQLNTLVHAAGRDAELKLLAHRPGLLRQIGCGGVGAFGV